MELQTAKYYQEPEATNQPEFVTFSKPGDDKPAAPPTHAEELSTMIVTASMVVLVVSAFASWYAVLHAFRVPATFYGRLGLIFRLLERAIGDYCKTRDDSWMTCWISSAIAVVAMVVIGCVPRNKSSKKACHGSGLAELALGVGEQLRGKGRHAFSIATAYLVGGTVLSVAGITWMVTLYQEEEPAGISVIFMTLLAQMGIAACLGGAVCLLREPPNAPQCQDELPADESVLTPAPQGTQC